MKKETKKDKGAVEEALGTTQAILEEFLTEFPYGVLKCTCEAYPQVRYANAQMFAFWGISESSEEWTEFISRNIFFSIPYEERNEFRSYLNLAGEHKPPVALTHRVHKHGGGYTFLIGWLRVGYDEQGNPEYHFFYMERPQNWKMVQSTHERGYLEMLKLNYELIFDLEPAEFSMECLYRAEQLQVQWSTGMRIIFTEETKREMVKNVHKEDQEKVVAFLDSFADQISTQKSYQTSELFFRVLRDGAIKPYHIVVLRMENGHLLMCGGYAVQKNELQSGGKSVDYMRMMEKRLGTRKQERTAKVVMFRVVDGRVHLLSPVEMVCRYFQLSAEEIEKSEGKGILLNEFFAKSGVPYSAYEKALREGEAVLDAGNDGKCLYVSKRNQTSGGGVEYLMLFMCPQSGNGLRKPVERPHVTIRTFGYFDVFVNGQPVVFHYEKSKEMLALLVDRNGSFASNPYFISCLWGDEPYGEKIQGRCRQTAYRMMETLKRYGIEYIIEKVDGKRRIIPEMVNCDYFNYTRGLRIPGQLFSGSYMSDYSWGEETLSSLLKNQVDTFDAKVNEL